MTQNIAAPVFNSLVAAFYLVILIGAALGIYAARQLSKAQKRLAADEAQLAAFAPFDEFAVEEAAPMEVFAAEDESSVDTVLIEETEVIGETEIIEVPAEDVAPA